MEKKERDGACDNNTEKQFLKRSNKKTDLSKKTNYGKFNEFYNVF